jgi:hypothetical protein
VGVIDYFDRNLWNTSEQGSVPTRANGHVFCRDSIPLTSDHTQHDCTAGGDLVRPLDGSGDHGVAVVEIVKDMAPDAEIYVATVGTVSDMRSAVDWFASKGVVVVTRSLGSPYDGPGDGTGPRDAVVDYAVAKGITWFNSAGNDAVDGYMRRTVPTNLVTGGYVNFNDGRPAVGKGADTWLRLDGDCVWLDGVRWSTDWRRPAAQRTDYRLEFWEPQTDPSAFGDHWNPTAAQVEPVVVASGKNFTTTDQRTGAPPLEGADLFVCPRNTFGRFGGITYLRVRALNSVGASPDRLEIATAGSTLLELDYSDAAGSASKPVVDSRNPGLLAVGAIDLPDSTHIADYSSRGPTADGRVKPDITAPSSVFSTVYQGEFKGTSAASPAAAGFAALLAGRTLGKGVGLASLMRHFVVDRGPKGPDNMFGAGQIRLPSPPPAVTAAGLGRFVPVAGGSPIRLLDTRSASHAGPAALVGPYAANAIVDLPVTGTAAIPSTSASAAVLNITSIGAPAAGMVQAFPYLRGTAGAYGSMSVRAPGVATSNMVIVPLGAAGKIGLWLQPGGQVVVDVLGWFDPHTPTATTDGRFVPLPRHERWLDTTAASRLPTSFGGTPRQVKAGETVRVPRPAATAVPSTGVEALVVHVTAIGGATGGWLRALPSNATTPKHVTLMYGARQRVGNDAIVPLGGGGISVHASAAAHVRLDVVGYITAASSPPTGALYEPITQVRRYNSRASGGSFAAGETRTVAIVGATVPADAVAVAAVLTVQPAGTAGALRLWPAVEAMTSSLDYPAATTVATGVVTALDAGALHLKMSQPGHLLIAVNGYFRLPF